MSSSDRPSAADSHPLDFESFAAFARERVQELGDEIDLDVMALMLTLHRASSAVVYDLESSIHRPAGWSWAGFRLLFVLWLAGPLEAKHAAQLSGNSRQATSTLANTLERDGLIKRITPPHDARLVEFALTPTGTQAIAEIFHAHNKREQMWASVLTPEERAAVTSAMFKLLAATTTLDVRRRNG